MVARIVKRVVITSGLVAAGLLGAAGVMRSARGRGAIFTLHHVRPKQARLFDPNAHLEITPDFLEATILRLKRENYRFIALDALPGHLASRDPQPVAVFTLDDGYRNNLEFAAPVFARQAVPFTVFVTGGFIDRTHTLWWETLADLIESRQHLNFDFGTGETTLPLSNQSEKQAAFDRIAAFIHEGSEALAVAQVNRLAEGQGIDPLGITERLTLGEAGLRTLVENPLASLGAHTISHRALARLTEEEARHEIAASVARVERIIGQRPRTLAYPYGERFAVSARETRLAEALGLAVAVTTQPGTLASDAPQTALPRISLNGFYQKPAYVSALASGIAFRMMRRG
ncbi:polysaccharide deacetylase family protein [Pararhizobium antarcticum]|uniref:Chitooligosaccharide deacetylase n=1 Tax=Pararhizobium antarcticum TaxID=1798805 RepID=A0A657LVW8_9HYPH|nr:polysaccharide deacetylase family protein [Pararhizobium antarcticum]OJF98770.1 polysaccharide deacetylase [Pararhizobium antarcticum]OJF98843.1 polysaccharide deacetylase [Pararhizobium antarcticum]